MATGYKTPGSGRKRGTPNKQKRPSVKQLAEELVQEKLALQQGQVDAALKEQTPLEFLLEYMRDLSNPPKERIECAKAALPYVHAKIAEEQQGDGVEHVTEIRTVIVKPPQYDEVTRAGINESRATGSGASG
jgi:hypothetical protein